MRLHTLAALLLSAALWIGCGPKKVDVQTSPAVPAAGAWVAVEEDRNDNTKYRVEIRHLARPERLNPPRSAYILWLQPPGQPPENAGQIQLDDRLRGQLRGVTPHRRFDLFVTAEDSISVAAPSGQEVLRTTVDR